MTPARMNPIGLLGGSFDPVHAGHLQLARDAQAELGLAQIVFIPAGRPWQKGGITPAQDRVHMLELAVAGHSGWSLDLREITRPGPSYTVETLQEWRAQIGPDRPLVWILGFDQLRQLETWHRWRELTDFAHIAFARRAGTSAELPPIVREWVERRRGTAGELTFAPCGRIVEFSMRPIDCSATQLRASLAHAVPAEADAGGNAARFLPPGVLAYIRSHGLYSAHALH